MPKVEIPQELLDRLKLQMKERKRDLKKRRSCPALEEVAQLYGIKPKFGEWWNFTISHLDNDYPDWRGYAVEYPGRDAA